MRCCPAPVPIIHSNIRIIQATLLIAADIPLCIETITAKDRITMIMAIAKVMPIFHIVTIMINTAFSTNGAITVRNPGINMTEAMIVLLATEIVANMTATAIVITITSSAETIINRLSVNKRPL